MVSLAWFKSYALTYL